MTCKEIEIAFISIYYNSVLREIVIANKKAVENTERKAVASKDGTKAEWELRNMLLL